ncbi:hypothetical protein [Thiohalophilus sp.]|uniref:hypothetical protein n=1 Tax=Thiohalophilus sp. TaxID=3028392 RepID=UPI002ACE4A60|nr:hypothetical protein [Thiohalophilus sp.]MDZ7662946.1 hypothetical protein [Thiohalophilus sp.]
MASYGKYKNQLQLNQLMSVMDYRHYRFKGPHKPSERSIRRWIEAGALPGKKIGARYFVDITAEEEIFSLATTKLDEESWISADRDTLMQRCYDYVEKYLNRTPRYISIPPLSSYKNCALVSH